LLTPINVFDTLGITHSFKQWMALVVGGIAGILAFIGCSLLLHRRLFEPRIRRSSSLGDILVLVLLWLQLFIGLASTFWTIDHMDGEEMVLFMGWAQGILTFQRSEEHTSELQSRENLVCRLLLEKKKNKRRKNSMDK